MERKEKIVVDKLYKIFGKQPRHAMQLLAGGLGKEEILERTGMTVGVQNASFSVCEGRDLRRHGPFRFRQIHSCPHAQPTH